MTNSDVTISVAAPVTTPLWRNNGAKRFGAALTYPLFYVLNRPAFQAFNEAAYDFALRCNGIAINFKGRHGLTAGEENFLRRYVPNIAGGVLLDVGANQGAYTRFLHALAPHSPVYAFEPHPQTFRQLQAATILPNVMLLNQALGEQEGCVSLFDQAADDGSTQASLSRAAVGLFTPDIVEHQVSCTTLDVFLAQQGISDVALLKIDTEGHDLSVLKGAAKAISERRIHAIQFEFIAANIATRVSMRDIFDALSGYKLHRLCMNGDLLPMPSYDVKRHEIYVTHNLVALPV